MAIDQVRFPGIPGVSFPRVIHEAYRVDYGPHWPAGIITYQPPRLGPAFPTLVAQVDAMGNEATGIRNIEILVPVATYTPWLLRTGAVSNSHELTDFLGTYIPLPRTEADRQRLGDPRPSLETLYATREAYLRRVNEAAVQLVAHGYLLAEDVERVRERAMAQWEWVRQRH